MASNGLPPIPSYEEAIATLPPQTGPDEAASEQQSLLRNVETGSSSEPQARNRRRPRGATANAAHRRRAAAAANRNGDVNAASYEQVSSNDRRNDDDTAPAVDDDDESHLSDWSSSCSVDEDAHEVRREMHEFDIEEPMENSMAYRWGKTIGSWRWNWRLRMPNIRLPQRPNLDGSDNPVSTEHANNATMTLRARFDALRARLPNVSVPKFDPAVLLVIVARTFALFLIIGIFYLLFFSDFWPGVARRMESRTFPPELVREHIQKSIDPLYIRETLRQFTSYAHIAGTEGDFSLTRIVERFFTEHGLEDVHNKEYEVFLNYPNKDGRRLEILGEGEKVKWAAQLEEPELGAHRTGHQTYVFHGYSKSGTATGRLVYANYGSRADFEQLKTMKIDTKGAIALLRYHGTQPSLGLKIKAAELAGFAACIVYTDPADNGFVRTQAAPGGRSMPEHGVQRASAALSPWVMGDPLTPGWESLKSQPRLGRTDALGLVGIPSLPLSASNAQELFKSIRGVGQKVPKEWVGGLPDTEYWSGDSSEAAPMIRLVNNNDEELRQPIWNVHGRIIGIEQAEKTIIVGSHRDAWASGATSPGSGTAVFLEVIRIFAGLKDAGWRPRRTIKFVSWDATEPNMVGSTEYVEEHLKDLQQNGYAYINLDVAVAGDRFRASGSPVFHLPLLRALNRVTDPRRNTTLRQLWESESQSQMEGVGTDGDYVPFQDMAGTSSLDLGFGGKLWPRASSYDTFEWMDRVGDPGLEYHAALAEVVSLLLLELADEPLLLFDLGAYALAIQRYMDELESWAKSIEIELPPSPPVQQTSRQTVKRRRVSQDNNRRKTAFVGFAALKDAVRLILASVKSFEAWTMVWQNKVVGAGGWESNGLGRDRFDHNNKMADFETALLDMEKHGGYPNRTQYKHVIYGPRKWSVDPEAFFPVLRDALEEGEWELANQMVNHTATILRSAAEVLAKGRVIDAATEGNQTASGKGSWWPWA